MPERSIEFVRLTEVPLAAVSALLNEPRNHRHMPLATPFTPEQTADWVHAKDAQWGEHGYGPWAILVDGQFAGWGGFQAEANGADYALVLGPAFWGLGEQITREALRQGFDDIGLDAVLISLPFSRKPDRAVAAWGFRPDGEVSHGGATFRQYRLTAARWKRRCTK